MAELVFSTPDALQRARVLVRAIQKSFSQDDGGRNRFVWLDVKKTTEEMRPARIVHRVAEAIQEIEATQSAPLQVDKKLYGKIVEVGGRKVGQVRNGTWVWLPFACNRYSQEQRENAKAIAEAD